MKDASAKKEETNHMVHGNTINGTLMLGETHKIIRFRSRISTETLVHFRLTW